MSDGLNEGEIIAVRQRTTASPDRKARIEGLGENEKRAGKEKKGRILWN